MNSKIFCGGLLLIRATLFEQSEIQLVTIPMQSDLYFILH